MMYNSCKYKLVLIHDKEPYKLLLIIKNKKVSYILNHI